MFSRILTRILVPYDGSKHSEKALNNAIELAHNLDSEIFLLTIVNVGYISPPGMLSGLTRTKSEREAIKRYSKSVKTNAEKLLKTAQKKCKSKGIMSSVIVKEGDVSGEILNFAKKKRITLIVIGSQGLHGIGKIKTLGSVSRKVSENSSCPVLIVR